MREINLDELKAIQIEILNDVALFCERHHIKYWIDCGTLLGAVRHGGYIPWDDDIDIGMYREDYSRFVQMYNCSNRKYRVLCIENDKLFQNAFGKVVDERTIMKEGLYEYHISIDVFPYDNAPDDDIELDRQYKKRDFWIKMRKTAYPTTIDNGSHSNTIKGNLYALRRYILRVLPESFYVGRIAANAKKHNKETTQRIGNFTGWTPIRLPKSVIEETIGIKFENGIYPAPKDYDVYLREFYGDYMQLPSEEERVNKHHFHAFVMED